MKVKINLLFFCYFLPSAQKHSLYCVDNLNVSTLSENILLKRQVQLMRRNTNLITCFDNLDVKLVILETISQRSL